MRRKRFSTVAGAALGLAMAISFSVAAAAKLDISRNLICATIDVVGCVEGGDCLKGHAKDFDLPQFVVVDAEKKLVRATDETGHKEISPVKNLENSGNELILQGVENGKGWSIVINQENGEMAATVAGKDVSFMVFGVCTAI